MILSLTSRAPHYSFHLAFTDFLNYSLPKVSVDNKKFSSKFSLSSDNSDALEDRLRIEEMEVDDPLPKW